MTNLRKHSSSAIKGTKRENYQNMADQVQHSPDSWLLYTGE